MCFPNKKQKNNFTDQPTEKSTKAEAPSSSVLPPIPQLEETIEPTPSKPQETVTQTNGKMARAPKVAIVIYTMYHHIAQRASLVSTLSQCYILITRVVAEAIKEGIEAVGGTVDILQYVASSQLLAVANVNHRVAETLPQEVLTKMYAPAKPDYPILTLEKFAQYDGWLFGIPTRYGTMPAQWKVSPYFQLRGSKYKSICQDILGLHWRVVAKRRIVRQVCWDFRVHRRSRRRTGDHRLHQFDHVHPSRHQLRSPGLRLQERSR
jgi:hypothetical protein